MKDGCLVRKNTRLQDPDLGMQHKLDDGHHISSFGSDTCYMPIESCGAYVAALSVYPVALPAFPWYGAVEHAHPASATLLCRAVQSKIAKVVCINDEIVYCGRVQEET